MIKTKFWANFYKWRQFPGDAISGYTMLLPVPGDLPVFMKLALDVCAHQASDHLIETLVVPDCRPPGLDDVFESCAENYRSSPLRMVEMTPLDRFLVDTFNQPNINHWLQLIRGAMATRTTHALLHDADLFITNTKFLKTHYEACVEGRLACLGVSPPWDRWYQEQGITHLAATWEMIFEMDWLRSFQPWQHQAQDNTYNGKLHGFDTTLWAQCHTPAQRIACRQENGFIHFNYVISAYRWFQQRQSSYEDQGFHLLLIRLLIDAYDRSDWPYALPSLRDLSKGLSDKSSPVTYIRESSRECYPAFRSKLYQFIESGLVDDEKASIIQEGVAPFERAFS
jgi:hypothetical protein